MAAQEHVACCHCIVETTLKVTAIIPKLSFCSFGVFGNEVQMYFLTFKTD